MKKTGPYNTVALENGRNPGCVATWSNWEAEPEVGSKVIDDAV
jgi:hypothetical protein